MYPRSPSFSIVALPWPCEDVTAKPPNPYVGCPWPLDESSCDDRDRVRPSGRCSSVSGGEGERSRSLLFPRGGASAYGHELGGSECGLGAFVELLRLTLVLLSTATGAIPKPASLSSGLLSSIPRPDLTGLTDAAASSIGTLSPISVAYTFSSGIEFRRGVMTGSGANVSMGL